MKSTQYGMACGTCACVVVWRVVPIITVESCVERWNQIRVVIPII